MLPLSSVIIKHINFHRYANDNPLYNSGSPDGYSPTDSLIACIHAVNLWLTQNSSLLSQDKTEILVTAALWEMEPDTSPHKNWLTESPTAQTLSLRKDCYLPDFWKCSVNETAFWKWLKSHHWLMVKTDPLLIKLALLKHLIIISLHQMTCLIMCLYSHMVLTHILYVEVHNPLINLKLHNTT